MNVEQQMHKAKALIEQKRYDEARQILEKINRPTARAWLAQLDARSSDQSLKASTTDSYSKRPTLTTRRAAQQNTRRSPVLLSLVGVVIFVVVVIGVVVILTSLTNHEATELALATTATVETPSPTITATASATATATEIPPTSTPTPIPVIGSGQRLPVLESDIMLTVELPQGWICECLRSLITFRPSEDRRKVINVRLVDKNYDYTYYRNRPLAEILTYEIRNTETVLAQETIWAGNREILFVTVVNRDRDKDQRYYMKNETGYVLEFQIPSYIRNPSDLQTTVVFLANNITWQSRSEAQAFSEKLRSNVVTYNPTLNKWRMIDNLNPDKHHTLELPPDWAIGSGTQRLPMLIKENNAETSATAIIHIASANYDRRDPLTSILNAIAGGGAVKSQERLQINGRIVLHVITTVPQSESESANYFVQDSDGDMVSFVIQPNVTDKDALNGDVLFMAGNIETSSISYEDKLVMIGVLPSDTANDGFSPVRAGNP